ncbi:hypothetical protein [Intestinibacillus massiliensis]|uniref:hypothetical protein n=1 Tax=Intestinibacillus massiliensis TaxID=1871029 RepID=UPI000B35691D|nr:hypothetical protein [Intestinibacillus massiliensis]
MRQNDVILDKTATVAPRSIQEDGIPRDGGLWPEYAHTLIVCVDGLEDGLAQGQIYSYCVPEERPFHSLDQMLFTLEDLINKCGLAQPWNEPRSLTAGKKKQRRVDADRGEPEAPGKLNPSWTFQDLRPVRGKLASFYLRVYSRQHASMQGVLAPAEQKGVPMAFRSALELLRALQGALEERFRLRRDMDDGSNRGGRDEPVIPP